MLVFLVGNYFVTFFIIGLVAAVISIAKKPKPLQINEVSEALLSYYLLFAIGINNSSILYSTFSLATSLQSLSDGKTARSRQKWASQVLA
jgi:hypothetical protein